MESESLPSVSCICPTANRPQFLKLSVQCFLGQDYPNKELVIVDDGCRPVHIEPHPLITVHRLHERRSVGCKRNIACSRAKNEIICHWDDDDWYAPDRITDQVQRLLDSGAVLSGYHTIHFANDELKLAWQYRGGKTYAVGTSFCYRRAYWLTHPFIDINSGEDNNFKHWVPSIATVDGSDKIVARVHSGNTSPSYEKLTTEKWTGEGLQMWKEIDYASLGGIGYPVIRSEKAILRRNA